MKDTSMEHIVSILATVAARTAEGAALGDDHCSGVIMGCEIIARELSESLEDPSILETYTKLSKALEEDYKQQL